MWLLIKKIADSCEINQKLMFAQAEDTDKKNVVKFAQKQEEKSCQPEKVKRC